MYGTAVLYLPWFLGLERVFGFRAGLCVWRFLPAGICVLGISTGSPGAMLSLRRYMTRSACWSICPLSSRNLAKSSAESMSHWCTLLSSILSPFLTRNLDSLDFLTWWAVSPDRQRRRPSPSTAGPPPPVRGDAPVGYSCFGMMGMSVSEFPGSFGGARAAVAMVTMARHDWSQCLSVSEGDP